MCTLRSLELLHVAFQSGFAAYMVSPITAVPVLSLCTRVDGQSDHRYKVTTTKTAPLACRGEEERLQAQTSRYHGVRQNKRSEKWESYIRVAGKHQHLGCHDSEIAAAQAFDQAVMLRHVYCRDGENPAPLVTNFSPEYYQARSNRNMHHVHLRAHSHHTEPTC